MTTLATQKIFGTFRPISHETKFFQIWDLCRNYANNINFHYRINSVKIKKFSINSKNHVFRPFLVHFPNFGGKFFFSGKSDLSCTTLYGFLTPCQNLEETTGAIPRKLPDIWTDRRMDRRTDRPYFIGPFWLPPEVQKVKI